MSNFSFLRAEWGFLHEAAHRAEQAVYNDPRTACFYARRSLELGVAWLYAHDKAFKVPYQDNLSAFIFEPSFRQQVGEALFTKAKLIKDLGNMAVHSQKKVLESDALSATRELFHFCFWLARHYGRTARPDPSLSFSPAQIPKAAAASALTQPQLQKLADELAERNEALATLRNEKATLDAELQQLRAEVAAAKQANAAEPDTHDYSEAETRKSYIDLLLREAGWNLNPAKNFEVEVTGMPNAENTGYVDYVFWGDDGKPLMLVEAKRTTRSPKVGQQQAKLYADCLEKMYGQRPIIFYSNGYEHWIWDDHSYPPPYGDHLTEGQLRTDIAKMLHDRVLAMNVDNFVVRPQRRYVEKFASAEVWTQLGADEVVTATSPTQPAAHGNRLGRAGEDAAGGWRHPCAHH